MSSVSKTSAYPASVQSGIPSLSPTPSGWNRASLSKYLHSAARPLVMMDDETYRLVTVKRSRGGVVLRENLKGREISVKSQFQIKEGDFLISKRQIVHGACGLVPAELDGSIVSNEYSILRGNDKICLEFLNYLAHSPYFQQTCFHSSIGVHIEKMIFKLDRWLKWEFNIPPIAEQRRIAEILSTWDRAIETTERLIANSEAQKKALMQKLLTGKKRLPGFSGEWTPKKLKALIEVVYGTSPKGIEKQGGQFPIIGTGGVVGQTDQITHDKPSIVIGRKGTIDKPQFVQGAFWAIDTTYFCKAKACDLRWLYQVFTTINWRRYNEASGVPSLSRSTIYSISVLTPPEEEQIAIRSVLERADAEITLQTLQLKKMRCEKAALMQQLLTGKRRVKIKGEAQAA